LEGLPINRWLAQHSIGTVFGWSNRNTRGDNRVHSLIRPTTEPAYGGFCLFRVSSSLPVWQGAEVETNSVIPSGCMSPCLYSCFRRRIAISPYGPLYKVVSIIGLGDDSDGRYAGISQMSNAQPRVQAALPSSTQYRAD